MKCNNDDDKHATPSRVTIMDDQFTRKCIFEAPNVRRLWRELLLTMIGSSPLFLLAGSRDIFGTGMS